MYSVVEMKKDGLFEVERVKTVEEAYDMLGQWMRYKPESKFEMFEVGDTL